MASRAHKSFIGSGFSFPFEITTALGGIGVKTATSISTGTERIRQSLIQILYTALGERVMLRSFGTDLRAIVFESMDPALLNPIIYSLRRSIEHWERRISVERLNLDLIDKANGLLQISIQFRELDTNQVGNLVFPFFLDNTGVPGRMVAARDG